MQGEILRFAVLKQKEKLKKSVGITMILDMDGMDKMSFLNSIPLSGNSFTDHLHDFLEFHPGIFARIFVVNGPSWFSLAFQLIKRALTAEAREVCTFFLIYLFHFLITQHV